MTDVFVIEVGKKFPDFCEIAYHKTDGYCLLHMDNFIWHVGTSLNDPYIAQQLLGKYLGISPLNANSVVQINKI
jgi:hypothetical protein